MYYHPLFHCQDVTDINIVINNEYITFYYFDSIHFSTANGNFPSRNNKSLDELDELINNHIESTINQCKYYDSQDFNLYLTVLDFFIVQQN